MDKPLVDELDRLIDETKAEVGVYKELAIRAERDMVKLHRARDELAGKKRKGRPPKILAAALVALGLLIPATASATTVSPDKQAELNAMGWTAQDDDAYDYGGALSTITTSGVTGDCAHARAKRAGTSLDYRSGNPMVRVGTKLAVCAANGKITKHEAVHRHASPGRDWRGYLPFKQSSGWQAGGTIFQAYSRMCWAWGSGDSRLWQGTVRIESWVKRGTDHDIAFRVHRDWSGC